EIIETLGRSSNAATELEGRGWADVLKAPLEQRGIAFHGAEWRADVMHERVREMLQFRSCLLQFGRALPDHVFEGGVCFGEFGICFSQAGFCCPHPGGQTEDGSRDEEEDNDVRQIRNASDRKTVTRWDDYPKSGKQTKRCRDYCRPEAGPPNDDRDCD